MLFRVLCDRNGLSVITFSKIYEHNTFYSARILNHLNIFHFSVVHFIVDTGYYIFIVVLYELVIYWLYWLALVLDNKQAKTAKRNRTFQEQKYHGFRITTSTKRDKSEFKSQEMPHSSKKCSNKGLQRYVHDLKIKVTSYTRTRTTNGTGYVTRAFIRVTLLIKMDIKITSSKSIRMTLIWQNLACTLIPTALSVME